MRRLLSVVGAAVLAGAAFAGVAHATGGSSCDTAERASYRHVFDGPGGTVTITALRPLCDGAEQAFSLASYTTGFVHDADSAWIGGGRSSVTLDVDVPGCVTQVIALAGAGIPDEPAGGTALGTGIPGEPADGTALGAGTGSTGDRAWYSGGTTKCAPQPSVTFESWCDGVLNTHLANAATATVNAVFVIGGKRIHVRPGEHRDLASRPSGPVEVRDNSLVTSTGSWTAPAGCTPAG